MKGLTLRCEFLDVTVTRLSEKDTEKTSKCEFGISGDDDDSMFIHAWNLNTSSTSPLNLVASAGGSPLQFASDQRMCGSVYLQGTRARQPATHRVWLATAYCSPSFKKHPDCQVMACSAPPVLFGCMAGCDRLCLRRNKTCVQLVAALIPRLQPAVTFTRCWAVSLQLLLCKRERLKGCWKFFFKEALFSQRVA